MRKRPFRTAWKTEIFEIVKTNTKPIEVSFFRQSFKLAQCFG